MSKFNVQCCNSESVVFSPHSPVHVHCGTEGIML